MSKEYAQQIRRISLSKGDSSSLRVVPLDKPSVFQKMYDYKDIREQRHPNQLPDPQLITRNLSMGQEDYRYYDRVLESLSPSYNRVSHTKSKTEIGHIDKYYLSPSIFLGKGQKNSQNSLASNGNIQVHSQKSSPDIKIKTKIPLEVEEISQKKHISSSEMLPKIIDRGNFTVKKLLVKQPNVVNNNSELLPFETNIRHIQKQHIFDHGNSVIDKRIRQSEQQLNQMYSFERENNQNNQHDRSSQSALFNQKYYLRGNDADDAFKKKILSQNKRLMHMFESMRRDHQKEIHMLKQREAETFELLKQQQHQMFSQNTNNNSKDNRVLPPPNFFLAPLSF